MSSEVALKVGDVSVRASCLVEIGEPGSEAVRTLADWRFGPPEARAGALWQLGEGTFSEEIAEADGLRLVREAFRPGDGSPRLAVRLRLTNAGAGAIEVVTLSPVVIGPDGLKLGEAPPGEWTYLRQPRHKNDMPAAAVLGSESFGLWDAVQGTPETGGVPRAADSTGWPIRFVSAEMTAVTHCRSQIGDCRLPEGASTRPHPLGEQQICDLQSAICNRSVLFGFFPLHQQFVQSVLELTPDRRGLAGIRLDCHCDRQVLAPGETLASQWVLIDLDPDILGAMERYTEMLLDAHPGARERQAARRRPPTVWCSWYYYGDGFAQWEAEANLQALRRRPLPIDVVQIDECWDQEWGDWHPNVRWPDIPGFAKAIADAGYRPGIWTCPLLADVRSTTRYHHPDWLLRRRSGQHVVFPMGVQRSFVLDPTHPEVLAFLEALYRRLTQEWGFTYHKLDFTRAIGEPDALFHDRTKNRAQAYRMALEAVRRGIGEEGYLNVCGGFYGPLLGLADAQRTGSDVKSEWPKAPQGQEAEGYGPFTIKQNTLRFWMNRLWDNDPDALMVRRRPQAYREEVLSLGLLSDDEALTCALNQYLGGGLVCFTENLPEVDGDRLLLLRHCSPSLGEAAIPRDALHGPRFPSLFDTRVAPSAPGLAPWHTLSLVNWHAGERTFRVPIDEATLGAFASEHEAFLVSAFQGQWSRPARRGEVLEIGPLPPHACEVLKVQPLGDGPAVLRTDGHFSMGGAEVTGWEPHDAGVRVQVTWPWPAPLAVAVAPAPGRRFANAPGGGPAEICVSGPLAEPQWFDLAYV